MLSAKLLLRRSPRLLARALALLHGKAEYGYEPLSLEELAALRRLYGPIRLMDAILGLAICAALAVLFWQVGALHPILRTVILALSLGAASGLVIPLGMLWWQGYFAPGDLAATKEELPALPRGERLTFELERLGRRPVQAEVEWARQRASDNVHRARPAISSRFVGD